jgi:hypothetical protein
VEEYLRQMWEGPGHFRFLLQPALAIALAIRDGVRDAKQGKPPFLVWLIAHRVSWAERLWLLIRHLALPLCLAVGMSFAFQIDIQGRFRPVPALGFAIFLVLLPYILVRAASNRAARTLSKRKAHA